MRYLKEFYYSESREGRCYRSTPPGRPDINRLLQGESAFWLSSGSIDSQLKKTLILADWSILSWSARKWTQVRESLSKMIDDGFNIYQWNDHTLSMLVKSDLSCLVARKSMIPRLIDHVYADAARYGIARDQALVLDDYWVWHIINQFDELQPRELSLKSVYLSFSSFYDYDVGFFIEHLQNVSPPIAIIVEDMGALDHQMGQYSYNTFVEQIIETFSALPCTKKNRSIYCSEKALGQISPEEAQEVELLCLDNYSFDDLKKKEISEQIEDLIKSPNFAWLIFDNDDDAYCSNDYGCAERIINSVESLILKLLSQSSIKFQLNHVSRVKWLQFLDFKHEDEDEELIADKLLMLEDLQFICSDFFSKIKAKFISNILNKSPHVKRLTLSNYQILGPLTLMDGSLGALEVLVLDYVEISPTNLFTLLRSAIRLKYLYVSKGACFEGLLSNSFENSEHETRTSLVLNHLKYATLSQTEMDESTLDALCGMAPLILKRELIDQIIEPVYAINEAQSSTLTLDAKTFTTPNQTLTAKKIFDPIGHDNTPLVSTYRLNVYDSIVVNPDVCSIDEAFSLECVGDLDLQPCDIPQSSTEIDALAYQGLLFYGCQTVYLSSKPQPLASLSPTEIMLRYALSKQHPITIQYSKRDNLYYISSRTQGSVTIEFTLLIQEKSLQRVDDPTFDFFRGFKIAPLNMQEKPHTGVEYLQAIAAQQKGSCRHRAFLCKYMRQDIHTRIVNNNCHSFIEWYSPSDDAWLTADLGGARVTLKIEKPSAFKPSPLDIDEAAFIDAPEDHADHALASDKVSYFDPDLRVWEHAQSNYASAADYYRHSLINVKKRLIECASHEMVMGLKFALQQYCHEQSRPCFYIHRAADLKLSAYSIKHNSNELIAQHSPLHEFLTHHPNGVLLINYNSFKADELVSYNSLLDDHRCLDSHPIPADMILVGLLSVHEQGLKPGNDFYSRFDRVEHCPVEAEALKACIPLLPEQFLDASLPSDSAVIDFFHAVDWESMLLGTWVCSHQVWEYQPGLMKHWQAAGVKSILIKNGPWENADFCRFWQELRFNYPSMAGCLLTRQDGYDWDGLRLNLEYLLEKPQDTYEIINPSTLENFFKQYQVVDDQLQSLPGYIEQASSKGYVYAYVTRALSEHNWAFLLKNCQEHQVKLHVFLAPDVDMPDQLQSELNVDRYTLGIDESCLCVISSSDVDATVNHLFLQDETSLVIDVTGCQVSDLFVQVNGDIFEHQGIKGLSFTQKKCVVLQCLEQSRTVILCGKFSDELVDVLVTLKHDPLSSLCFVVCEDAKLFNYLTCRDTRIVLAAEPFVKHQARLRYSLAFPDQPSDNAWLGIESIMPGSMPALNQPITSQDFNRARVAQVERMLAHSRYVLLTGLSGVGKSTFILANFSQGKYSLHLGQSAMLAWALDDSANVYKILFWDEINLSKEVSCLENMMRGHVLINGNSYPLSSFHKVIGAMNPHSFGGERQLSPFILRHGSAYLFTPLPNSVLYEQLQACYPYLRDLYNICKILFKVYEFLCEISAHELLISPRELQMMVLLTAQYSQKTEQIASYFAYHLAIAMVPGHLKQEFSRRFQPRIALPTLAFGSNCDYKIMPSRQDVCQLMRAFLDTRILKPAGYGLGGLIIEGEPGIGKSELVVAFLKAYGLKKLEFTEDMLLQAEIPINAFYKMPSRLNDKRACLLKLFHAGCVVIMDEFNSSVIMEDLLNVLLTGQTPDGILAKNRGFMIIATQNPKTMTGRRSISNALYRRMTTVLLPNYTETEMQEILCQKGMYQPIAHKLINSYNKQRRYAEIKRLTLPTFRDVLRVAEKELDMYKKLSEMFPLTWFASNAANSDVEEEEEGKDDAPQSKRLRN